MMQVAEPSDEERQAIESQLSGSGPIEQALASATAMLSGLSSCAGIVQVPKREPRLKQFGFARLSDTQLIAVLVGEDGSVENRLVEPPPGVTDATLAEASNYLTKHLAGLTLSEALERLDGDIRNHKAALDRASADLVREGLWQPKS